MSFKFLNLSCDTWPVNVPINLDRREKWLQEWLLTIIIIIVPYSVSQHSCSFPWSNETSLIIVYLLIKKLLGSSHFYKPQVKCSGQLVGRIVCSPLLLYRIKNWHTAAAFGIEEESRGG